MFSILTTCRFAFFFASFITSSLGNPRDAQLRDRSLYYSRSTFDDDRPWLIVEHVNKLFDVVDFPHILSSSFPECPFGEDGVCLRWSYHNNPPIAVRLSTVRNFVSTICYDEVNTPDFLTSCGQRNENDLCICQRTFPKLCDTQSRFHVCCSASKDTIPDLGLTRRIEAGANFRDAEDYSLLGASDALFHAFHSLSLRHDHIKDSILQWGFIVISRFKNNVASFIIQSDITSLCQLGPSFGDIDTRLLFSFRRHFSFLRIDKATSNIAIVCNRWLLGNILQFVSDSSHYDRIFIQTEWIINVLKIRVSDLIRPRHDLMVRQRLPFFYVVPKMHKKPIKARPIVAAIDCVFSCSQRVLSVILRLVLDTLKHFHMFEFERTGIRKFWLVENSLDFVLTRPDEIIDIFSSDVDSMYHNLNQDFIFHAVLEELRFAMIHISNTDRVFVSLGKSDNQDDYASWLASDVPMPTFSFYTVDMISNILSHILSDSYFTVGDTIFRQTCGLPMGGASSPHLANIALHHLEKEFVERNLTSAFQHNVYRFMDDFCVCNSHEFINFFHLIYPEYSGISIVVNDMPKTPGILTHAHFLDMYIYVHEHSLEVFITLYDKRTSFPFDIHKFPHASSNACSQQIHNIFFGEVIRLYRINSHLHLFLQNVASLFYYCITYKLYNAHILEKLLWRFVLSIHSRNHFGSFPDDVFFDMFRFMFDTQQ